MLFLCDHNKKDPDGQWELSKTGKRLGKGEKWSFQFQSHRIALSSQGQQAKYLETGWGFAANSSLGAHTI